jgi:membrane protein implicated in regulation of membrane protease activity
MNLKAAFPVIVMGYLLATGVFFLAVSLFDAPFLEVDQSRELALGVIAVVLISLSLLFYLAWRRGQLRKRGKTLLEVRLEAVEKAKERSTVLKIADDPEEDPLVRERARERLKDFLD